jgi:GTP cyclohydrolase I
MLQNGSKYAVAPSAIVDVHNQREERRIPIDRVGVSEVSLPIVFSDRSQGKHHSVAKISMSVNLSHRIKGAHMSRFMEIINEYEGEMTEHALPVLLRQLQQRLGSDNAFMNVTFPYFLVKAAPESGARGWMAYEVSLIGELKGDRDDFVLRVQVPVASLCPCSKAISDYGAHNQRGYVTIDVRTTDSKDGISSVVWIEELVKIAESSASAPVYPVLKRPDERYVTMQAYDNPVFVEDIARGVAQQLERDQRVAWFRVQVENHESIHSHNVFAEVEWTRPDSSRDH